VVLELSTQLGQEVRTLTAGAAITEQSRLCKQIHEAVDGVSRNIAEALEADRDLEFARHIRLARASATDVRDGLQVALMKRCVSEADLRQVRVVLGRLFPALNSLLVLTANFRSETPVRSPSYTRRSEE
jgi:four helix bundle protein